MLSKQTTVKWYLHLHTVVNMVLIDSRLSRDVARIIVLETGRSMHLRALVMYQVHNVVYRLRWKIYAGKMLIFPIIGRLG